MSDGSPAWRPWALDETAARPFFVRALDAGINFFDTADMSSLGVSEVDETLDALHDLVRTGKVRNFGASSGPGPPLIHPGMPIGN